MYRQMKKLLFLLDPEAAHERTIAALKLAKRMKLTGLLRLRYAFHDEQLSSELWGIPFPNPVGLAAGFDKNAEVYEPLAALGFGFIEVGTVTPLGQPGNDKPRLFRLVEDEAVINRMGFNNEGAENAAANLQNYEKAGIPIGINFVKNKATANDHAVDDYIACLDRLYEYGHYFVINVSSPNTPNLRDLQETEGLRQLVKGIQKKKAELEQKGAAPKPILVKVAPDMAEEQMHDIVQIAVAEGLSGIIATNTTLARDGLRNEAMKQEAGGLSGKPLRERSTAWIQEIYQEVGGKIPIIGVGGIFNGDDAYAKIRAGASLVQVYTGMIYEGPGIIQAINKQLKERLERDGFRHIREAVGFDVR